MEGVIDHGGWEKKVRNETEVNRTKKEYRSRKKR